MCASCGESSVEGAPSQSDFFLIFLLNFLFSIYIYSARIALPLLPRIKSVNEVFKETVKLTGYRGGPDSSCHMRNLNLNLEISKKLLSKMPSWEF